MLETYILDICQALRVMTGLADFPSQSGRHYTLIEYDWVNAMLAALEQVVSDHSRFIRQAKRTNYPPALPTQPDHN